MPSPLPTQADEQVLRLLAAIPAFTQWSDAGLPPELKQWIRRASRDEVMSAVAAGLQRLYHTDESGRRRS